MAQAGNTRNQFQTENNFYLNSDGVSLLPGYLMQKVLGSGSFATVYKAVKDAKAAHDKEQIVAIKAIHLKNRRLTTKVMSNLEVEIKILSKFRHRNIVALNEVHKTDSHFFLILEYCSGGDLQHLINSRRSGRLSERLVRRLMRDLSNGLKFLWDNNLIHRDIKPQNLLLTGPLPLDELHDPPKSVEQEDSERTDDFHSSVFHLKIADFGFARYMPHKTSLADTLCGSPLYMAPEVLQQKKYDGKADLWSVGTVIFEMITGSPPFRGENQIDLLRNIQQKAVRLPQDMKVSKQCVTLLRILLTREPSKRASFDEFYDSVNKFVALGCNNGTMSLQHEQKAKGDHFPTNTFPSSLEGLKNNSKKLPNMMLQGNVVLPQIAKKDSENNRKSLLTKSSNGSHNSQLHKTLPLNEQKRSIISNSQHCQKVSTCIKMYTPPGSSSSIEMKSKLIMSMNEYSPVCLEEELNQNLRQKCVNPKKMNHGSFIMVDNNNNSKLEASNSEEDRLSHNIIKNEKVKRSQLQSERLTPSRKEILSFQVSNENSLKSRIKSEQLNRLKAPIIPDLDSNINKRRHNRNPRHCPNESNKDHKRDVKLSIKQNNSFINIKALLKILGASEDVGRRAVAVARLGDERILLAVKNKRFESRNFIVNETVNRNYKSSPEMDNYLEEEMPFVMNTLEPLPRFPSNNNTLSFNFPEAQNESKRLQAIYIYHVEGLRCYLKSMNLLKSSINGCVSVLNQLEVFLNESHDFLANELKCRCEISHSWLTDQFVNVLERADLTNGEIKEDNYGKLTSNNEIEIEKHPKGVKELIYDGFLALGQDGAVKKLLAQFELARNSYRNGGLLVETLLMDPKLGEEDCLLLENYLLQFSQCITEVDIMIINRDKKL